MTYGLVMTSEGPVKVPVRVVTQRAGLPQFIIQGYRGNIRSFRQAILSALSGAKIKLPSGRIVVDLELPTQKQVWGVEGLGLAVVHALVSRSAPGNTLVVGEVTVDGQVTLAPQLVAALSFISDTDQVFIGVAENACAHLLPAKCREVCQVTDLLKPDSPHLVPKFVSSEQPRSIPDLPTFDPLHCLELALVWAGGHSLLLFGAPGEGKTRSRDWLTALAPPLTITQQRRRLLLAGGFNSAEINPVLTIPPTSTLSSWSHPRSGWLRQATDRVIWQDELPEVTAATRIRMRAWLDGSDQALSALQKFGWQTAFVATMNPCPCGRWGESSCVCSPAARSGQLRKVSWPLIERYALQWRVEKVDDMPSSARDTAQEITALRIFIAKARQKQQERWGESKLNGSAHLNELSPSIRQELAQWAVHLSAWSTRRQIQVAQVAQTLLDGQWVESVRTAMELSWRLCRGTQALRAMESVG